MRLLLLLILLGAAAHFTIPAREAHEAKARAALEAYRPDAAAQSGSGDLVQNAINFATGMMAGQGRYESFYVFSKYTLDMPGVQYLECYGAFTLVQCRVVEPAAPG